MKTKRFSRIYRKSASKYHKAIGDLLKDSPLLSGYKIYQEYPANKINTEATGINRLKYDWVILDLKTVIEVHGQFHYEAIAIDCTKEEAEEKFLHRQHLDQLKKEVATQAGYTYIEIPYTKIEDLSIDELKEYIYNQVVSNLNIPEPKTNTKEINPYKKAQLERARLYRKEQYQRLKKLKQRGV